MYISTGTIIVIIIIAAWYFTNKEEKDEKRISELEDKLDELSANEDDLIDYV